MDSKNLIASLENGAFDDVFARLYGQQNIAKQRERYSGAVREFVALYGDSDNIRLFSAPGRTEIGGNHTDHNHGCVVAASVISAI